MGKQNTSRRVSAAVILTASALAGCTSVPTPTKGDPLEGLNRTTFAFNEKLDQYALAPAARAYVFAVPQPVRDSIFNFFSNIGDVYSAANNLLQLKVTDGVEDVMRVAINTVFGVGGLFDVATLAKLPKHNADFGLTLGHYGVPPGPYLVLPLLGPSTVRDTAGMLVDFEGDLTTYIRPIWLRTTLYGIRVVSVRASLLDASNLLASAALDKYSFVRNTYLQRRQYMISDGDAALPTYDNGPADDTAPAKAPLPPSKAEAGTTPSEADGQSNTTGSSPSNSGTIHEPTNGLQMMPPGRYYSLPGPFPR